MDNVENLTEETFEWEWSRPGITVIDVRAAWCGTCRAMAPQFERAAAVSARAGAAAA